MNNCCLEIKVVIVLVDANQSNLIDSKVNFVYCLKEPVDVNVWRL